MVTPQKLAQAHSPMAAASTTQALVHSTRQQVGSAAQTRVAQLLQSELNAPPGEHSECEQLEVVQPHAGTSSVALTQYLSHAVVQQYGSASQIVLAHSPHEGIIGSPNAQGSWHT